MLIGVVTDGFYILNTERMSTPDPVAVQNSDFTFTGLAGENALSIEGFWVNYTALSNYVPSSGAHVTIYPFLNVSLPFPRLATLQANSGTSSLYLYYAIDHERVAEVNYDLAVNEWVNNTIDLTSLEKGSADNQKKD